MEDYKNVENIETEDELVDMQELNRKLELMIKYNDIKLQEINYEIDKVGKNDKTEDKCNLIIKKMNENSERFCEKCDGIIEGQQKIMDILNKMKK